LGIIKDLPQGGQRAFSSKDARERKWSSHTSTNLNEFLGVRKYDYGRTEAEKIQVGQVIGACLDGGGW
jgi:ATP-dependent Lon protease